MAEQDPSPRIARYKPYYYKPVPGRTYLWCRCGRSRNQPFCDGSHKGTGFQPLRYVAGERDREVLFCGCKHTATPPFCDGAHNNLREIYEEDDPSSEANRHVTTVLHARDGRYELNGHCFVARVDKIPFRAEGNVTWRILVNTDHGATQQAYFHMSIGPGESPVISFGDAEVVLLAAAGTGTLRISGRRFDLAPESGISVRPGEAFQVENAGPDPVNLYAAVSPPVPAPSFLDAAPDNFDASFPERVVTFRQAERHRMGNRTFQLLVNEAVGCRSVTQFIGTIPLSKAAPHRHLYEESIVLLRGRGCMWTEDLKANVQAGDFIFLPAKQVHSLQCTDPEGMLLAGVIHPQGNPNINY